MVTSMKSSSSFKCRNELKMLVWKSFHFNANCCSGPPTDPAGPMPPICKSYADCRKILSACLATVKSPLFSPSYSTARECFICSLEWCLLLITFYRVFDLRFPLNIYRFFFPTQYYNIEIISWIKSPATKYIRRTCKPLSGCNTVNINKCKYVFSVRKKKQWKNLNLKYK